MRNVPITISLAQERLDELDDLRLRLRRHDSGIPSRSRMLAMLIESLSTTIERLDGKASS